MNTLNDFSINDRVELHPATDLWFRGARYGTVIGVGHKLIVVHVDKLNGTRRFPPQSLTVIERSRP